jgi:putative transcriptional regulator
MEATTWRRARPDQASALRNDPIHILPRKAFDLVSNLTNSDKMTQTQTATSPFMEPPQARYDAVMLDYATGGLPTGPAFVVASHLALRPRARALVNLFEAGGGALLDAIEPVPLAKPDWLASEDGSAPDQDFREIDMKGVLTTLGQGRWQRNFAGMLTKSVPGIDAQLLRLEAGRKVPHHGHHGLELTLVLAGSFEDGLGTYSRGDLVVHDESSEHQPGAPIGGDCICLIAQTAPVRLNGALGWVQKMFVRT